jgi:hypothetical protein
METAHKWLMTDLRGDHCIGDVLEKELPSYLELEHHITKKLAWMCWRIGLMSVHASASSKLSFLLSFLIDMFMPYSFHLLDMSLLAGIHVFAS